MTVKGKIIPLHDKIIVCNMNFDQVKTQGGIILPSDDGKESGIHPRWAQVLFVGPEQKEIKVRDWVLVEHGRWSRGIKYETAQGDIITIRLIDNNAILLITDQDPANPDNIKLTEVEFTIESGQ